MNYAVILFFCRFNLDDMKKKKTKRQTCANPKLLLSCVAAVADTTAIAIAVIVSAVAVAVAVILVRIPLFLL